MTNEFLGNLLPVILEHRVLRIETAWRQGGQRHVLQGSRSAWCQLVEGVAGTKEKERDWKGSRR